MKQLSSGTVEKVSCGALKFRCCNKHFDKIVPNILVCIFIDFRFLKKPDTGSCVDKTVLNLCLLIEI